MRKLLMLCLLIASKASAADDLAITKYLIPQIGYGYLNGRFSGQHDKAEIMTLSFQVRPSVSADESPKFSKNTEIFISLENLSGRLKYENTIFNTNSMDLGFCPFYRSFLHPCVSGGMGIADFGIKETDFLARSSAFAEISSQYITASTGVNISMCPAEWMCKTPFFAASIFVGIGINIQTR